jgi:hypothetical protein
MGSLRARTHATHSRNTFSLARARALFGPPLPLCLSLSANAHLNTLRSEQKVAEQNEKKCQCTHARDCLATKKIELYRHTGYGMQITLIVIMLCCTCGCRYTGYEMRITLGTGHVYPLIKRYSDFLDLHLQVLSVLALLVQT